MNPGGEGGRYGPMTRCHFERSDSPGDEDGPRVLLVTNWRRGVSMQLYTVYK